MGDRVCRRVVRGLTSIISIALLGLAAQLSQVQAQTLRFVPQGDLKIVDPIWTTAIITRNFGFMVFDTLFSTDADQKIRPQMIESWSVSSDGLRYDMRLRPGLLFHNGQPVRAQDCVASVKRWSARDATGQILSQALDRYEVIDEARFAIHLKRPLPLLVDALGKLSSNVAFIMPEHLAATDPDKQITEVIGSGPFKFAKDEWAPGHKVVFLKFADYVPRVEPASWSAGGKVVKVDRVEWIYLPDAATAAAALQTGEIDWWGYVPNDLIPVLSNRKDISVASLDPAGILGMLQFNHTQPPFNSQKLRLAVQTIINREDYLEVMAGEKSYWFVCDSIYPCGSPLSTNVGMVAMKPEEKLAAARRLVKESGYAGETAVVLAASDQEVIRAQALVTVEYLKKIGINVELAASDTSTVQTRRASKKPVAEGGWSIFHTWWTAADLASPASNTALRANGSKAWFGWQDDPELEKLRLAWFDAADFPMQKRLAADIQKRVLETAPFVVTGQFTAPSAYRNSLTGIVQAPVHFFWNVEKH